MRVRRRIKQPVQIENWSSSEELGQKVISTVEHSSLTTPVQQETENPLPDETQQEPQSNDIFLKRRRKKTDIHQSPERPANAGNPQDLTELSKVPSTSEGNLLKRVKPPKNHSSQFVAQFLKTTTNAPGKFDSAMNAVSADFQRRSERLRKVGETLQKSNNALGDSLKKEATTLEENAQALEKDVLEHYISINKVRALKSSRKACNASSTGRRGAVRGSKSAFPEIWAWSCGSPSA